MTAHPETKAHAWAWVVPMAKGSSSLPAFNDNEHRTAHPSRGKAAGADAHSHVRCGHGLSHMVRVGDDPKIRSSFYLLDVPSCELAPVSAGVPFTRIQIGRLLRLPQLGVQRCIARPHFHSRRSAGANQPRVNSCPHQDFIGRTADVGLIHLIRCLSSEQHRLVGIDPNENGLTHAQASFAHGAKAYD